jgi:hypothetical protein
MKIKLEENPIVVGCNYHTTWQSDNQMRFVLSEIKGDKARLTTRRTNKDFWTNIKDLIFIQSGHNKSKAIDILRAESKLKQTI